MCTSKPKIPAPTPVIERQAYKSPVSRASLSSGTDPNARRRLIAGVATSAQGVLEPASTTRRVKVGGDTPMMPSLGGSPSSTGTAAPAPATSGPTMGAQTGTPKTTSGGSGVGLGPGALAITGGPLGLMALAAQAKKRVA